MKPFPLAIASISFLTFAQLAYAQETPPAENKEQAATKASIVFTSCAPPSYPQNSARNNEQGTVVISLLISVDGKLKDVKIDKSSRFIDLDKATVAMFFSCGKFRPATENDKPTDCDTLPAPA